MTDAEQREKKRRDSGWQEERDGKARGDQSSRAGETSKSEAESDRLTRLACWRSRSSNTGRRRKRE